MRRLLEAAGKGDEWVLTELCFLYAEPHLSDEPFEGVLMIESGRRFTVVVPANRSKRIKVRFEDGVEGWIDPASGEAVPAAAFDRLP